LRVFSFDWENPGADFTTINNNKPINYIFTTTNNDIVQGDWRKDLSAPDGYYRMVFQYADATALSDTWRLVWHIDGDSPTVYTVEQTQNTFTTQQYFSFTCIVYFDSVSSICLGADVTGGETWYVPSISFEFISPINYSFTTTNYFNPPTTEPQSVWI